MEEKNKFSANQISIPILSNIIGFIRKQNLRSGRSRHSVSRTRNGAKIIKSFTICYQFKNLLTQFLKKQLPPLPMIYRLPVLAAIRQKCFFCSYIPRSSCATKGAICSICEKKDIIRRYVNPNSHKTGYAFVSAFVATLAYISASLPGLLSKVMVRVKVNGMKTQDLIDTGSINKRK